MINENKKTEKELKNTQNREDGASDILDNSMMDNRLQKKQIFAKIKNTAKKVKKKAGRIKVINLPAIEKSLLVSIDISDYSIEVLLLNKSGFIVSYGRDTLDEGVVEDGEIIDQRKLSKSLKKILKETKPKPIEVPEHTRKKGIKLKRKDHKAIVSLPDSKTYTQVFNFDDQDKLHDKVRSEVRKSIPFNSEDLYWDFVRLPSEGGGARVLCVAAQRDIVDMYIYFFKSTNIDPVAFEVEGVSIGRSLLPIKKSEDGTFMSDRRSRMIIDMGARTSILSIFDQNADLAIAVSLPYAGNYFTKKVSKCLNTSKDKAEKKKQRYGFEDDSPIFFEMKKHGQKIVDEIKQANNYYSKNFGEEVKEVILAGGTSLLPEIDAFISERIDLRVKRGRPAEKIKNPELLEGKKPILFSNVIGLGLRSIADDPVNCGINLLPEEVKSQAKSSERLKYKKAITVLVLGLVALILGSFFLLGGSGKQEAEVERGSRDSFALVTIGDDFEEVNIFNDPNQDSDIIGVTRSGEIKEAIGRRGDWVKIKTESKNGWILGDYLSDIEIIED